MRYSLRVTAVDLDLTGAGAGAIVIVGVIGHQIARVDNLGEHLGIQKIGAQRVQVNIGKPLQSFPGRDNQCWRLFDATPMSQHDHAYKNLFAFPRMMEDLLKGFVRFDWVNRLDFSTLEKVSGSYITDDLRERADDVIWRVRFQDEWLYVYLLLEFQSTVDPFMAVRIQTYVGLLYQDLIKANHLPAQRKLPPVLPIVLYNGEKRWYAPESVSELVQAMPEKLLSYQPQQRYLLIDEGRYSAAELETLENLTAALICAEIAENPQ